MIRNGNYRKTPPHQSLAANWWLCRRDSPGAVSYNAAMQVLVVAGLVVVMSLMDMVYH